MALKINEGDYSGKNYRFAIVVSRFNDFLSNSLVKGAVDMLTRHHVADENIEIFRVPGAFEIPLISKKLASSDNFDAVIALGAVIRGSTPHFDYVAGEVSKGVAKASYDTGIPIIFGVLTTDSIEQAVERSGSKAGNRGSEAAMGALEMVNLINDFNI